MTFKRLKYISLFIAFSILTFANAQVDKEKKSIRIPAEQSEKEKDSSPQKIKVEPKKLPDISKESGGTINGISTKGFNKYKIKESENNFSMVFDDGLRNPGEIFEKRWKKDATKTGMIRTMSDQFLGEHRTNTKFVNIVCRDHEYPDGDRVRIFLNDEIVYPEILLTGSYRRVQIDLLEGINKIDIQALNQGESGPNTAEFIVYDDKGSLVSSKEWNLLTGVKATIIFINEKIQIEPKSEGN